MQNKIYMTLAYLHEQIKGVIDGKGSLNEVIDSKINNIKEVVNARKGYDTVGDKIDSIDSSVSNVGLFVKDVEQKAIYNSNSIENLSGIIEHVKNTNPTVEVNNGEKLLVSIKDNPKHKTNLFYLNAGEQKRFYADAEHYVNSLYTSSLARDYELILNYKSTSAFDRSSLDIREGYLHAAQTGMMKLPLHNSIICGQVQNNIITLPSICNITGICNSKSDSSKNHIISAFKTGSVCNIKTNILNIIFDFEKPIWIDNIRFNFKSNTSQQTLTACYLDVTWKEIAKVPSIDNMVEVNREVKTLRLTFDAMSESQDTRLDISNIEVIVRKFVDRSGVCYLSDAVDSYSISEFSSLNVACSMPDDTYVKYGISNKRNPSSIISYYPRKRVLESGLFRDLHGNYVIGNIDSLSSEFLTVDASVSRKPLPGDDKEMNFTNVSWDEDFVIEKDMGLLLNPISYLTLYVTTKSKEYRIMLSNEALNNSTSFALDNTIVELELKNVNGSLRVVVRSKTVLENVKLITTCLQDIYSIGDGSSVRAINKSSSILSKNDSDRGYTITSMYNCVKDTYNYKHDGDNKWSWHYDKTNNSKYNQTQSVSFVSFDSDFVESNVPIITSTDYVNYIDHCIEIRNTKDATCYIGDKNLGYLAYLSDCNINQTSNIVKTTSMNEFIGRIKKTINQKVIKITSDFSANSSLDIEYFLSTNNHTFYSYNKEHDSWVINNSGMSHKELMEIPHYALSSFLTSDDIYIKVRVNSDTAILNGIIIEFDKSDYIEISENQLIDKGMNTSDLQSIDSEFILELMRNGTDLTICMESFSKFKAWPLVVPNIELVELGGIYWELDNGKTASQYIAGNTLVIKNTSIDRRHYKLEQKYFTDDYVSIGTYEDNLRLSNAEHDIDNLNKEKEITSGKFDLLDQNINIVSDAINKINNTSTDFWYGFGDNVGEPETVSLTLPSFLIPTQKEIDLGVLLPGSSTAIRNIDCMRYIQFWNIQRSDIPESIEHKTIKENKHYFENNNGYFTPSSLEISQAYDTGNVYEMGGGVTTSSSYSFTTGSYVCQATRSDGKVQAAYGAAPIKNIVANSGPGSAYKFQAWNGEQANHFFMPGEDARWMDFDFTFTIERYIHSITELQVAAASNVDLTGGNVSELVKYTWQVTSIYYDKYGDGDWVLAGKFYGYTKDWIVDIKQGIRRLRVRIEVPYSYNRGSAYVMLKYLKINYCPLRYTIDKDATIKPIQYYDTNLWGNIISVHSDAYIYGNTTGVKYLFEATHNINQQTLFLTLVSGKLEVFETIPYDRSMSLFEFNNLTEVQLSELLKFRYVRPIAILKSEDGLHTPSLKSFKITYVDKYSNTMSIASDQDIKTTYDKQTGSVIVTNATDSVKTLKAIIS